MGEFTDTERWATFSPAGDHRLLLGRRWADGPLVAFIGLNPSTADADTDDPTTRRCMGFAQTWGFAGVLLGNLFTFRTPDPRLLSAAPRALAFGADNALREIAEAADLTVEAWGAHPMAAGRAEHVRDLLEPRTRRAVLGTTQDGAPRHPLYTRAVTVPQLVTGGHPHLHLAGVAPLPGSAWLVDEVASAAAVQVRAPRSPAAAAPADAAAPDDAEGLPAPRVVARVR